MFIGTPGRFTAEHLAKALKRFEWLISFMICRFRFVHMILGYMNKTPRDEFGTMGVHVTSAGKFELMYDPAWLEALTDAEATYIFFHEVLHLALHHCTKRKLDIHEIANVAYDLAVNELIPESDACSKPIGEDGKIAGCHVSEFKKKPLYHDIQDKQTSEWYYDYLIAKQKEQGGGCKSCQLKGSGSGGNPQTGDPQDGDPKDGEPQEGQGEGKPEEKPEEKHGKGKGKGKGKEKKCEGKPASPCDTCPHKIGETLDSHDGWAADGNEIADERVRAIINRIKQHELWGTMSQGVKEMILAAQVKRVNWRSKMRNWFGLQAWREKRYTRKRPNRRTGYIHPGTTKTYRDKWLVAADVSGSTFTPEMLGSWIAVINQIQEEMPIDFMQFDCAVTVPPHPYDCRKDKVEMKGSGGTDFNPVMEIVIKGRYKGVTILTDGAAAVPTKPNAKVLWILPEGMNPPVEWGDRVHITKHD
jgi:predicted metal-dependent peptidase